MIINYTKGISGIIEYLQNGQKKNRDFSRDELDQRVPLVGDINETQHWIDNVNSKTKASKEKYKHFVLSFKEDFIPTVYLRSIATEFKDFILKEYRDNEANYYAEAHLPKIKTFMSKGAEVINRKPHIHVVIPTVNSYSRTKTLSFSQNRFNFKKYQIAFQESINAKYGLISPLDLGNRNLLILHSYRLEQISGVKMQNDTRDIKIRLLEDIIVNNINSQNELINHISKKYSNRVSSVEHNFNNEYLFVKFNNGKGMSLKDFAFSETFLSLDQEKKITLTNDFFNRQYNILNSVISPGEPRQLEDKYVQDLKEYNDYGAKEIKYGRYFGKKYNELINAEPAHKAKLLDEADSLFYANNNYIDTGYQKDISKNMETRNINAEFNLAKENLDNISQSAFLNILEKKYGVNILLYEFDDQKNIYSHKSKEFVKFSEFLQVELNLTKDEIIDLTKELNIEYLESKQDIPISTLNNVLCLTRQYEYDPNDGIVKSISRGDEDEVIISEFREYIKSSKSHPEKVIERVEVSKKEDDALQKTITKLDAEYFDRVQILRRMYQYQSKLLAKKEAELKRWRDDTLESIKKKVSKITKVYVQQKNEYSMSGDSGESKFVVDNRFRNYLLNKQHIPNVKNYLEGFSVLDKKNNEKMEQQSLLNINLQLNIIDSIIDWEKNIQRI